MSERLLIVEDTRVFAQMLKSLVWQQHGFIADVAESLEETQAILAQGGAEKYFAAIVDLHLPDAPDGEAIDAVVAAKIPTIVFTGTADEAAEEDLWSKNIADYAHKSSAYSVQYVVWMTKRLHENSSKHILIVDDSRVARSSMSKILATQRFNVISASSGEEALGILAANQQIEVAIIDWNMDGMDGFELTAKIRKDFNNEFLEIIGISSHGGRSNSARFIKSGADDFLLKPFIPEEFLCRVNRAAERIDQYKKLKELNEIKNQFLSTAAHDLRGPLSAIYNAARLSREKDWSQERKNHMLQMIETNSKDLQTLLNELLDYSVIESGRVKLNCDEVDFAELVRDRVNLYSPNAEAKSIGFTAQIIDSLPIKLDRVKIQQVVDNLITNAIKFSPTDSKITVALDFGSDGLKLQVIDQGPGVTQEDQANLFKPYQTLSSQSTAGEKQTGLGLAIAKNIVTAHEGQIFYSDASEGGATFTVTLPMQNQCALGAELKALK